MAKKAEGHYFVRLMYGGGSRTLMTESVLGTASAVERHVKKTGKRFRKKGYQRVTFEIEPVGGGERITGRV